MRCLLSPQNAKIHDPRASDLTTSFWRRNQSEHASFEEPPMRRVLLHFANISSACVEISNFAANMDPSNISTRQTIQTMLIYMRLR